VARPRASDHDAKRQMILDKSAELFAANGYARTSISEIAEACGSSKALLYHYYANKEQLLFDILNAHFSGLITVLNEADQPDLPPEIRLRDLVRALMEAYEGADATHKVQLHDLTLLPPERQKEIKAMERDIVRRFSEALRAINPKLDADRKLLKPVTMSLFGMMNWHYLWFRPSGALTREGFADLITDMIIVGARKVA